MRHQRPIVLAVLASLATAGCYSANKVTAPDEIFSLTVSPETIAADGVSTAQLTAHVASNRNVQVVFSASGGGTLSPAATVSRTPDGSGNVVSLLTSDSTPKSVLVTAEVKQGADVLASRSVTVTFSAAVPTSVIRLSASSGRIDADGNASVQLRAEVNSALSNRNVTFKTTNGSFVRLTGGGGTGSQPTTELPNVTTGADGVAITQLYAPTTPGTALVTATAGGFSASQTIVFAPALPDFISLSATPLQQSRALETNTIQLTATLSREVGTVTQNTRVEFTAVNDTSGESFGRFQSVIRSNANEQVTAQFVPGAAAPLGLATITARVLDTNVTARVKVNIIP